MTIRIIGIDAEWQLNSEGDQNSVLSYQWFGLYTGEALKKEEKSSIRIIPKHSENSDN